MKNIPPTFRASQDGESEKALDARVARNIFHKL
jgi:hypothetical protein